ncbi:MAG: DUF4340 domain-containing protein [Bdellovibrionota bacterium]
MKRLAILGGVVLALLLIVLLVPKQQDRISGKDAEELEGVFPHVMPEDARRVTITYQASNLELVHHDDKWWVKAAERDWPADSRAVDALFQGIGNLQLDRAVSGTAEKHDLYELTDTKSATVKFFGERDTELLAVRVGKLGPDMKTTYVRGFNEPKVYVAQGSLRPMLERKTELWRDRSFARLEPNEIHKLLIEKQGKPPLTIERDIADSAAWKVTDPKGVTPTPTFPQECDNVARQFASMVASDLPPPAPDAEYGFDKPAGTVTLTTFNGKTIKYTFGKTNEARQIYARNSDAEGIVYLLQSWMADRVMPTLETLLGGEPQVSPLPPAGKK